MSFRVAPSILSADFANLEKEIKAVAEAGADWIHVDVMDGHFVPNLTIGAPVVKALKKISPLPLDVHLMIEKPENLIEDFLDAGADYLTIHVEATDKVLECLEQIRERGCKAGITLRPQTPIEDIEAFLPNVDLVLIMTVNPGFGGQAFMAEQMEKASFLVEERKKLNLNFLIEVDGGINADTAKKCQDVDVLVAGNYVFKNSYAEAIAKLKASKV
jgi:ribulose-phosphate 3-epimerase